MTTHPKQNSQRDPKGRLTLPDAPGWEISIEAGREVADTRGVLKSLLIGPGHKPVPGKEDRRD